MNPTSSIPARSGLTGHLMACSAAAALDNIFRVAIGATLTALALAGASNHAEGSRQAESLAGWVMILFTLPFIIWAPTAGTLGDRLPKHLLIRLLRVADVAAVGLGLVGFWLHSTTLLLMAITTFATISAFFAPVKLAIMPELVDEKHLPRANGWLAALTVVAILAGTAIAALHDPLTLHSLGLEQMNPLLALAITASVVTGMGIWGAWRIPRLAAVAPSTPLAWPWQVTEQFRAVHAKGIGMPAWCLALFWAIGAVAMVGLTSIAGTVFGLKESAVASLSLILAVGLILGSLAAPVAMHRAYPAGLPIIGALLTAAGLLGAGWSVLHTDVAGIAPAARFGAALETLGPWMLLCGIGGGLWEVPLTVIVQERSPAGQRNQVMAGVTVLANAATVFLVLAMKALTSEYFSSLISFPLHYQHAWIILGGLVVAGSLVCIIFYRRQVTGWLIVTGARWFFRVRATGIEHLPMQGGCLLVCNHLSYADSLVLAAALPRRPRYLVHRDYANLPVLGFFLRAAGAIPISSDDRRRALMASLDAAVALAAAGELVVIFPEGKLSRSGTTDTFHAGLERIAARAQVPVIPAWMEGLWGGLWSVAPRRRLNLQAVLVRLGPALPSTVSAAEARQAVMKLGHDHAVQAAAADNGTLGSAALAKARRHPLAICVLDAQGQLSMWQTLATARALIPALGLAADERRVGIVLPPGRAGTLVNLALALDGRIAVNLNHTTGPTQMATMAAMAELRTVISAGIYLRRIGNPAVPGRVVLVEDLLPRLSRLRIMWHALQNMMMPTSWVDRARPDEVAAIVFSSGSTGDPKGVQLTHRQILANCRAVGRALDLVPFRDVLLSPLPLFHSFGLVPGMWLGLANGLTVAAHPDPRDGEAIGKLCTKAKATFVISTPSFIRGWMRRVSKEEFSSLRFAVAGAERCPAELRVAFKQQYGADLLEGYGCTELSPVVAVNLPDVICHGGHDIRSRDGSVGRALPGIQMLVIDVETHQIKPAGTEGLLVVRSPARMLGYLGRPDLTDQAFMLDGYNTGDIGTVESDGFVRITGRLARFAKIAGEMVPLDRIEAALQDGLRLLQPETTKELAVTSVSDESKGERLMVLHTGMEVEPGALLPALEDLPALWRPRAGDFRCVAEIPKLGTGKRDLAALKRLAEISAHP